MIELNKRLKHKLFPTVVALSVRLTLAGLMTGKEYVHDGLRVYPIGPRHAPIKWGIHELGSNVVNEVTDPRPALNTLLKHAWGEGWEKFLK